MNQFHFQPEYETQVFINSNGGITVTQDDPTGPWPIIVFSSKARAKDVADAIIALSKIASFESDEPEREELP